MPGKWGGAPPLDPPMASKCSRIVYLDEDGNEAVTFTDAVFKCRTGPGFAPDLASFNSQLELCESNLFCQNSKNGTYKWWILDFPRRGGVNPKRVR